MFKLSRHNDPRKTSGWYLEAQCVKSFNKGGLNRCLADGVLPFFFFHHAHSNIYRTRVSARVSWFTPVTLYTNKTIIKISSWFADPSPTIYIYMNFYYNVYRPYLNSSKYCLTTRNSTFPLSSFFSSISWKATNEIHRVNIFRIFIEEYRYRRY